MDNGLSLIAIGIIAIITCTAIVALLRHLLRRSLPELEWLEDSKQRRAIVNQMLFDPGERTEPGSWLDRARDWAIYGLLMAAIPAVHYKLGWPLWAAASIICPAMLLVAWLRLRFNLDRYLRTARGLLRAEGVPVCSACGAHVGGLDVRACGECGAELIPPDVDEPARAAAAKIAADEAFKRLPAWRKSLGGVAATLAVLALLVPLPFLMPCLRSLAEQRRASWSKVDVPGRADFEVGHEATYGVFARETRGNAVFANGQGPLPAASALLVLTDDASGQLVELRPSTRRRNVIEMVDEIAVVRVWGARLTPGRYTLSVEGDASIGPICFRPIGVGPGPISVLVVASPLLLFAGFALMARFLWRTGQSPPEAVPALDGAAPTCAPSPRR